MTVVPALFYVFIILALGYSLLGLVLRNARLPVTRILYLSFGMGAGAMSCLLFWTSLLGQRPSRPILEIILAGAAVLMFVSSRCGWVVKPSTDKTRYDKEAAWTSSVPPAALIFLLVCLTAVSWHALGFPLFEWDAFAIWGLKAKVVYYESLFSKPAYFREATLSYSHLDYPLGLPFLVSGAYAALGGVNDQWGKVIFPFLAAAFILMLFDSCRWKLNTKKSLIIAAVCIGNSPFLRWAGSGNADLLLTFYYGGSILYLLKWLENRRSGDLLVSALFAAFGAFTKNEGLVLAAMNLLILLMDAGIMRRRKIFYATASFIIIQALFSLPWLIWSMDIPRTHENYFGRLTITTVINNLPRLNIVLPYFMQQAFWFGRWGGIWMLLIAFALMGWRAFIYRPVAWGWVLFILHGCLYILAFVVTPWDIDQLVWSSLDRLLMHLIPLLAVLVAFHWAGLTSTLVAHRAPS